MRAMRLCEAGYKITNRRFGEPVRQTPPQDSPSQAANTGNNNYRSFATTARCTQKSTKSGAPAFLRMAV